MYIHTYRRLVTQPTAITGRGAGADVAVDSLFTWICFSFCYCFFLRTLARKTSEVSRSDTHPYISPSAHGPVASSHNIALQFVYMNVYMI